jgi:hypothetical protein
VTALRWLFAAAALAYVVGILVQVFLAGAALFEATDFVPHMGLGWTLSSASLLLIPLAIVARSGRGTIILTVALALGAILQPELASPATTRRSSPRSTPAQRDAAFSLAVLVARRAVVIARDPLRPAAPAPAGIPAPAPPITD